jgi:hypothetical protein
VPPFLFFNEVLIPLAGMATGLIITLSVVKAITRQLDRRHDARLAVHGGGGDVEGLRTEVVELRGQVEALEERLDFTERLLTQERNRRQLEGERGSG